MILLGNTEYTLDLATFLRCEVGWALRRRFGYSAGFAVLCSRYDTGSGYKNHPPHRVALSGGYFQLSLKRMVPLAGESLNTIFQELADWEHQLKALEQDIPIEWEEPSP
jgi:hypothetical protein